MESYLYGGPTQEVAWWFSAMVMSMKYPHSLPLHCHVTVRNSSLIGECFFLVVEAVWPSGGAAPSSVARHSRSSGQWHASLRL